VKLDAIASLLVDVPLSPQGIGGAPKQVIVSLRVLQSVPRACGKTSVLDNGPIVRTRRPDDVAHNPGPFDRLRGIWYRDVPVDNVGFCDRPAARDQVHDDVVDDVVPLLSYRDDELDEILLGFVVRHQRFEVLKVAPAESAGGAVGEDAYLTLRVADLHFYEALEERRLGVVEGSRHDVAVERPAAEMLDP
jgi:hypothetical protein